MRVVTLVAAAAALMGTAAQAQQRQRQCLTEAEAAALVTVVLPAAATAASKKCETALPTAATLRAGLPPLLARWRADGVGMRAQASAAALKLSGSEGGRGVTGETLLDMFTGPMLTDMVGAIKPETCVQIERAMTLLSPLPTANLAGTFVLLMQFGAGGGRAAMICTVPPR